MFIQTEETPNPAVLKFMPGRAVMGDAQPADFPNMESAAASPLAQSLFQHADVENVFLGADFIAVTKTQNTETNWEQLKPQLLAIIMDFFMSGAPVMHENLGDKDMPANQVQDSENAEIITAIKQLLDTRVRPAVAQDGGDIIFHSYEDGIVYLHMRGACAGCPSATATLQQGVENLLKHFVPVIKEVRPIMP
ncbi:MAG: NifU family protein [Alphaproteobacteria bacterium]|nr:NifU family protein [Alphaproteobacteria bacterium]